MEKITTPTKWVWHYNLLGFFTRAKGFVQLTWGKYEHLRRGVQWGLPEGPQASPVGVPLAGPLRPEVDNKLLSGSRRRWRQMAKPVG